MSEECSGEVWMAKLFDPARFVPLFAPLLLARAKAAGLEIPLQLGLCLQDNSRPNELPVTSLRLVLGPRSVKLVAGTPLRSQLTLRQRDLTALLLGHWSLADIVARGRIRASTQLALHIGSALFPALPFWHPPLDQLLA